MPFTDLREEPRGLESYHAVREGCGLVVLEHMSALLLKGRDRVSWLQGQVTNDLRLLEVRGSIRFCLCTPTGQLRAICEAWCFEDFILILTHKDSIPFLVERCETMVILEDVQAELFSGALLSLQGPLATDCLAAHFNLRPTRSGFYYLKDKEALVLSSDRCGAVGWDICLPCTVEEALGLFPEEIPRVSPSVFRLISLETGNPVWGEDADSKTLPPELGEAFERSYISYQKGCYTGQEVLMRIHSQGHTNRTWMGLLAEEKMLPGWNLSHPSRTHIGSITSAGWSPLLGYVAAGYIRNEFARHGGEVVVQHEAGSFVAQIYQMPLLKLS